MRKIEDYDEEGTILEIWYNFDKKGVYNLNPLTVMIQDKRRTLSFEKITVTDDPAKMLPRIVIVFEDGTTVYSDEENIPNPLMSVPVGQKLKFTINLQYATQIFKFTWDIPKNSIFTQTKEYEITEVKYRERVYSHDLIPVADFEWTGLLEETEPFPKLKINATGYNGYRNELLLPDIQIRFTAEKNAGANKSQKDIFAEEVFGDGIFKSEAVFDEAVAKADVVFGAEGGVEGWVHVEPREVVDVEFQVGGKMLPLGVQGPCYQGKEDQWLKTNAFHIE